MIKKRSVGLAVFLYIITLGIYPLVLMCIMGREINKICEGDGKKQMHFLLAVLLGFVTLGIYPVVWCCKAMNRLCDNAYRYGPTVHPSNSGSSYVLWTYFGLFIAVGPIVAFCKFLGNVNAFADVVGYVTPLPYTSNAVEKIYLAEHNDITPNSYHQEMNNLSGAANQQINIKQTPAFAAKETDSVPETSAAPGYASGGVVTGSITGISGMYKDFVFPVMNNECMILGKNAQFSNIVIDIDSNYVSSKHCSVRYYVSDDSYEVTDFSTNGTYSNDDIRIQKNTSKRFRAGSIIYLGTRDNSFKLG